MERRWEELGERLPYKMQHFLGRADWDSDALRDELQQYVKETLGDGPGTIFVLDETGILKKGTKSACVNRQYSGTAGRIEKLPDWGLPNARFCKRSDPH